MKRDIREATVADIPALSQLVADYYAEQHDSADDASRLAQFAAAQLETCIKESSHSVYVAEHPEGQLAGYLVVHWIPFPLLQGVEGYISDLLVAQTYRGQGIGKDLLAVVEHHAQERGCIRLMLNNRRASTAYQRGFYPHAGFVERKHFANFVKKLST